MFTGDSNAHYACLRETVNPIRMFTLLSFVHLRNRINTVLLYILMSGRRSDKADRSCKISDVHNLNVLILDTNMKVAEKFNYLFYHMRLVSHTRPGLMVLVVSISNYGTRGT